MGYSQAWRPLTLHRFAALAWMVRSPLRCAPRGRITVVGQAGNNASAAAFVQDEAMMRTSPIRRLLLAAPGVLPQALLLVAALPAAAYTWHDHLDLNSVDRNTAWVALHDKAPAQHAPAGFAAKIGALLPDAVAAAPVPDAAKEDVEALKPYDFAVLDGAVLIVNPVDRKVVAVIAGPVTPEPVGGLAQGELEPHAVMPGPGGNLLALSDHDMRAAWRALHGRTAAQPVAYTYFPHVGTVLPEDVAVQPIPDALWKSVPQLKGYDFAVIRDELVIVNPANRMVVERIAGG